MIHLYNASHLYTQESPLYSFSEIDPSCDTFHLLHAIQQIYKLFVVSESLSLPYFVKDRGKDVAIKAVEAIPAEKDALVDRPFDAWHQEHVLEQHRHELVLIEEGLTVEVELHHEVCEVVAALLPQLFLGLREQTHAVNIILSFILNSLNSLINKSTIVYMSR